MSFSLLQIILREYGINTQKSLTSLNIQRNSGIKIVAEISRLIDSSNELEIRRDSRALLRRQNIISLT